MMRPRTLQSRKITMCSDAKYSNTDISAYEHQPSRTRIPNNNNLQPTGKQNHDAT